MFKTVIRGPWPKPYVDTSEWAVPRGTRLSMPVLHYIKLNPGSRQPDIAEALKRDYRAINRVINQLNKAGLLTTTKSVSKIGRPSKGYRVTI